MANLLADRLSVDARANVNRYLEDRSPGARYSSFDYCFNYFRPHFEAGTTNALVEGDGLETSCLQLGFYLASWGMFRGSSELLKRSVRSLVDTIEVIALTPRNVWSVDVDGYTNEAIDFLLQTRRSLANSLPGGKSDTLVTKTMLGVFGCVPAFDTLFKRGFGTAAFGRKALLEIKAYYDECADEIEALCCETLEFATGVPGHRRYTRAKVIDMIFFIEGRNRSKLTAKEQ